MSVPEVDHLYIGGAGEYLVMAELMVRGYNVAVPRIDTGDDVLVIRVRDEGDEYTLRRVQVKTARPSSRSGNCSFTVRRTQLESVANVDLWYVFLVRSPERWRTALVFRQETLRDIQRKRGRKATADPVTFEIKLSDDGRTALLGSEDLSRYIDDWSDWPMNLSIAPGA